MSAKKKPTDKSVIQGPSNENAYPTLIVNLTQNIQTGGVWCKFLFPAASQPSTLCFPRQRQAIGSQARLYITLFPGWISCFM